MGRLTLYNKSCHKGARAQRRMKVFKTLFVVLFTLLAVDSIKASPDTLLPFKLTQTIKGSYTNFSVDNMGNIYLITASNQLKTLNYNLDSIAVFNDSKRFGDIYSIDVSNPLKVLVYYKDFNTILMLDRQLNNRNTIDLSQQGYLQVKAIAQSYDNKIWLFDEVDNKLKKIDESGNLLLETPDFRLLFDGGFTPQTILDMNGLLYLYNPKGGWKVFDYYGGFKSQYPVYQWQDVQVFDGFLKGHDSTFFYAERPKDMHFQQARPSISIANAKKIVQRQNLCYILTKDGIDIYTVNE